MSCQGDETELNFCALFSVFASLIPDFCNRPESRRVGYRVGSSGTPSPMSPFTMVDEGEWHKQVHVISEN